MTIDRESPTTDMDVLEIVDAIEEALRNECEDEDYEPLDFEDTDQF